MRHWIGKNNLIGRLRYWYYCKRGWVKNGFWVKYNSKMKGKS